MVSWAHCLNFIWSAFSYGAQRSRAKVSHEAMCNVHSLQWPSQFTSATGHHHTKASTPQLTANLNLSLYYAHFCKLHLQKCMKEIIFRYTFLHTSVQGDKDTHNSINLCFCLES